MQAYITSPNPDAFEIQFPQQFNAQLPDIPPGRPGTDCTIEKNGMIIHAVLHWTENNQLYWLYVVFSG